MTIHGPRTNPTGAPPSTPAARDSIPRGGRIADAAPAAADTASSPKGAGVGSEPAALAADASRRGRAAQSFLGEKPRTTSAAPPLPTGTSPPGGLPGDLYDRLGLSRESPPTGFLGSILRATGVQQTAPPAPPTPAVPVAPGALRTALDKALPKTATTSETGRERILDRAQQFQATVEAFARTQKDPTSPLGRLRAQLGDGFAKDAAIELHGVASHFGPEGLQARVTDASGKQHTFVQGSDGAWVARPDLQARHAAGAIPSAAPGMTDGAAPTATFAVASVAVDGKVATQLPAGLNRFRHEPRAHPFRPGDSVQVNEPTGALKFAEVDKRLVEDDRPVFGTITSHDGRGNWQVTMPDKTVRTVTDEQLREANNPTILKDGVFVYDASFDSKHPAQRRLVDGFRATAAAAELQRTRPGPGATADERAAWERKAIDAVDRFLDDRMKYPPSEQEIAAREQPLLDKQETLRALDVQLALLTDPAQASERAALKEHRKALAAELATLQPALEQELAPARRYLELERKTGNIGEYADIGLGQCRHQALGMQLLLQDLGVDTRMTRGAANTSEGNYRGEHMWLEATLSNGTHLLVDPTWSQNGDVPTRLDESYQNDARRIEDPGATVDDYRRHLTHEPATEGRPIFVDDVRQLLA